VSITQIENELGRTITISAEILESGDVQIEVASLTSETTNLLTRREAEALRRVLTIALDPPGFAAQPSTNPVKG
jgi:hypothetical protein